MNKQRRNRLGKIKESLADLVSALEEIKEEEEAALYNLPESLQDSERGESMTEAIFQMEEAIDNMNNAMENLEEASDNIQQ